MELSEIVLLQIRMKLDLVDNRLVLCNLQDPLDIFDSKVGNTDVLCEALSVISSQIYLDP
jgi:hypothetical protein